MIYIQTVTKIPPKHQNKPEPPLHSIEYAMIDDIESLSLDEIKNRVNLLQQCESINIT
ncbi:MAG: hypothetical protein ABL857_02435 [Rickettsiales bacterium]|jgi:hypothetical protein